MNCKYCKSEFEPYKRFIDCPNCEDGMEEYEYDYHIEPQYRTCRTCNGTEEMEITERDFCSEDCIEYYVDEIRSKSEV